MQMQPESTAGVLLGTIHASKGLEWSVVFLPGLDEGLLPHARSLLDRRRLEEEHRLFYVALTRAMRQVYLLSAQYRTNVRGQVWECRPSRFLSYLPHGALRMGSSEVFLVEGTIDCLLLWQWEYPSVATLGSRLKQEHVTFLQEFSQIYYVPNRDDAGRRMWKDCKEAFGDRLRTVLVPEDMKDVGDLAEKAPARLFARLVDEAI
jgi:hypothetical protein